ncbi:28S ribosomal protein S31, mitochondrial-like [Polyodon spathula]|uniref:28S ribosomal protein S31, mitochondrial-like n=1 Tax=Polyodon spathula TaxID=7913 RepID=UPI001B7D93DC|nr:28S ribosomal protein S31, mitochondrial-like [Polyodon spathula]
MYRRVVLLATRNRSGINPVVEHSVNITNQQETKRISVSTCPNLQRMHYKKGVCAPNQRSFSTSKAISKESEESSAPKTGEKEAKVKEKKPGKSGKENLLDLLSAMKVDVTTKKKFQASKSQKSKEQPRVHPESMESATSMFQKATTEQQTQKESLSPELVAAASAVASSMPFKKSQTESELLQQLRKHESDTEVHRKGETNNIGNIIADMKVGKRPNARSPNRPANQIRFDDDGRGYTHDRGVVNEFDAVRRRKSLFTGKRLNIFPSMTDTTETEPKEVSVPSLWDIELAGQIAAVIKHLPRNGFEEMIQWTKDGKLWQYPINNEAGLEEESDVPFHEHVFLDSHLEDFPKQGPVRHFMELVINGLSKNPYLTVKQKIEHIEWFRGYFQQKEDVLKESEVY